MGGPATDRTFLALGLAIAGYKNWKASSDKLNIARSFRAGLQPNQRLVLQSVWIYNLQLTKRVASKVMPILFTFFWLFGT